MNCKTQKCAAEKWKTKNCQTNKCRAEWRKTKNARLKYAQLKTRGIHKCDVEKNNINKYKTKRCIVARMQNRITQNWKMDSWRLQSEKMKSWYMQNCEFDSDRLQTAWPNRSPAAAKAFLRGGFVSNSLRARKVRRACMCAQNPFFQGWLFWPPNQNEGASYQNHTNIVKK